MDGWSYVSLTIELGKVYFLRCYYFYGSHQAIAEPDGGGRERKACLCTAHAPLAEGCLNGRVEFVETVWLEWTLATAGPF